MKLWSLFFAMGIALVACKPVATPLPAASGSPAPPNSSTPLPQATPTPEVRSDGRICAAPSSAADEAILKYPIDLAVSPDGQDIYIVSKRCGEPDSQKPVLKQYTFPDCGAELAPNKPVPRSYIYHLRPGKPLEVLKIAGQPPLSCELGEDIEIDSKGQLYVTTPYNHRIYRIDPKQQKLEQVIEAKQKQLLPTDSDPVESLMKGPMSLFAHRDQVYFRLEATVPLQKSMNDIESHIAVAELGQKYTALTVLPLLSRPFFNKTSITYALADHEANVPEGFETSLYLYEAERLSSVVPFPSALKPAQTLGVNIWIFNPFRPDTVDAVYHATFDLPHNRLGDMKLDQMRNVYVTHPELNRLLGLPRHADFLGNYLTKFAGSTEAGLKDGVGDEAQFRRPAGLALDAQGNVYVADMGNHAIRRVTKNRTVTTLYPEAK